MKRYSTLLILLSLFLCSAAFAQTQPKTSSALTGQMLALDFEIEQQVQSLVDLLASVDDSVDSNIKVADIKQQAIRDLKKSLDTYQRERQIRMGELQQNRANIPREALAQQVDNMDAKIEERIDQIMKISESFAQDKGFNKYSAEIRDGGRRDDFKIQRVSNPDYKQNERAARRGEQTQEAVIEGLEKFNQSLTLETTQLERRIPATPHANRPELEAQIAKNREMISANEQKIEGIKNNHSSGPLRDLSRQEARDLEQQLTQSVSELRQKQSELVRLKAERDRLLVTEKARRQLN